MERSTGDITDSGTIRERLKRLPVFPLPNGVLIPGGHLPLHVFEPRYRALVRDCLRDDRLFAVGLLEQEELVGAKPPAIRPVAGLGEISAHAELSDGRFFILVKGIARTRILEELRSPKPYRVVRAVAVHEEHPLDAEQLSVSTQVLKRLVSDLTRHLPEEAGKPMAEACLAEPDPGLLADTVASAVLVDTAQRQRFLEELDVVRRLELMNLAVAAVLERISSRSGGRTFN
jgi:Lon protease-like protein